MAKWIVMLEDRRSHREIAVKIEYELPPEGWTPKTTESARQLALARLYVVEIDKA